MSQQIPPQKVSGVIHACPNWDGTEFTLVLSSSDMTSAGWIPIQRVDVNFDGIAADALQARQLVLARGERAELVESFTKSLAQLDEKISKLLAIAHNPTQENVG